VIPDEHAERKLDPDRRVMLHERRAGAGAAEHNHHLVRKLQPDLSRRSCMVELREELQTATFDAVRAGASASRRVRMSC
jgi:hypothetical protein